MSPQIPKDVPVKKHTAFTAVPRYFAVPALLGFLLILGPLVGLLYNIPLDAPARHYRQRSSRRRASLAHHCQYFDADLRAFRRPP